MLQILPFFGDTIDAIGAAISNTASAIFVALKTLADWVIDAFKFVLKVLSVIIRFIVHQFRSIGAFFKHLWQGGFKDFIHKLWKWAKDLKRLAHDVFDPIICAIKVLIDYEDALFNFYLRPLLNLIQHIRSFLALLRLLHVKWAARLDARLFAIETRLANSMLNIRRELNTVRNYISLILNPFGLFNPVVLVNSIYSSIGDIWNALHVAQERALGASELDMEAHDKAIFRKGAYSPANDKSYFDGLADGVGKELSDITRS